MALNDSRKVDQTLNQIEDRIRQVRASCQELLISFEQQDRVSYQDTINKFSSIASVLAGIQTTLKKPAFSSNVEDYGQLLKSHVIVPRQITLMPDSGLQNITEGRLVTCDHEVVPNILRARLHLELEDEERKAENDRSRPQEQQIKQIPIFNKHLDTLLAKLNDISRQSSGIQRAPPVHSTRDTDVLVRAICRGVGIHANQQKPGSVPPPQNAPVATAPHGDSVQSSAAQVPGNAAMPGGVGAHPTVKLK